MSTGERGMTLLDCCVGVLAVIVVSSGVAWAAVRVHRRMLLDVLKKTELEMEVRRARSKKKVRFAPDVVEPSSNNKEYRRRRGSVSGHLTEPESSISLNLSSDY